MRTYVPTLDFAVSEQFYRALGFEVLWSAEGLPTSAMGRDEFSAAGVQ